MSTCKRNFSTLIDGLKISPGNGSCQNRLWKSSCGDRWNARASHSAALGIRDTIVIKISQTVHHNSEDWGMISVFVKSFGIQRLIRFYLDRTVASNMPRNVAWPSKASTKAISTTIDTREPKTPQLGIWRVGTVDVGVRRIKMFLFLSLIAFSSSQRRAWLISIPHCSVWSLSIDRHRQNLPSSSGGCSRWKCVYQRHSRSTCWGSRFFGFWVIFK